MTARFLASMTKLVQVKEESQEFYLKHARFEMPLDIQVKMSSRQLDICLKLKGKVGHEM